VLKASTGTPPSVKALIIPAIPPVVLLLLFAAQARAEPLDLSNQHPLAQLHLAPSPRTAFLPEAGELKLAFTGGWSNTVNRERGDYLIDTETREGALSLEYAVGSRLSVGLRQALIYRGAGVTDSWIDDWHQIFGLPRGARSKIPEDRYRIEGVTREGEEFSLERSGTHFSDLDLNLKSVVYAKEDQSFDISLSPMLRLPTGSDQFGQDGLDFGLGILMSTRLEQWEFDFGGSYFYFGDENLANLRFEKNHLNAYLSAEYQLVSGLSLFGDIVAESALLANVPQYPDFQTYLDLGLGIPLDKNSELTLGVRENPYPEDSTTDISVFFSLRWRGRAFDG